MPNSLVATETDWIMQRRFEIAKNYEYMGDVFGGMVLQLPDDLNLSERQYAALYKNLRSWWLGHRWATANDLLDYFLPMARRMEIMESVEVTA